MTGPLNASKTFRSRPGSQDLFKGVRSAVSRVAHRVASHHERWQGQELALLFGPCLVLRGREKKCRKHLLGSMAIGHPTLLGAGPAPIADVFILFLQLRYDTPSRDHLNILTIATSAAVVNYVALSRYNFRPSHLAVTPGRAWPCATRARLCSLFAS